MKTPTIHTVPTKEGRPHYMVRIMRKGKDVHRTFNTKGEAKTYANMVAKRGLNEALRILHNIEQEESKLDIDLTINKVLYDYADLLVGVTQKYKSDIRAISKCLHNLNGSPIIGITRNQIADWVEALLEDGDSAKNIKNKHGILFSVMKYAQSEGYINSNPCIYTSLPRVRYRSFDTFTPDEFSVFIECVTPYYRTFVTTMFITGLRFGEITALKQGDVNLRDSGITVDKAWSENGKVLSVPKTQRSNRTITIPLELVEKLEKIISTDTLDLLLFVNKNGEQIKGSTFSSAVWYPAFEILHGKRDKLPKWFNPDVLSELPINKTLRIHDARHTCATWLLTDARIPIHAVSDHLGHSSIETTVKRYGHVLPGSRQKIALALSKIM
jgi:integrase